MKRESKKEIAKRELEEEIIISQNISIAYLMGGHNNGEGRYYNVKGRQRIGDPDDRYAYVSTTFKYHLFWDGWLKDAVIEICSLDASIFNYDLPKITFLREMKSKFQSLLILTPHKQVFDMVAAFAEWYNLNKPVKVIDYES